MNILLYLPSNRDTPGDETVSSCKDAPAEESMQVFISSFLPYTPAQVIQLFIISMRLCSTGYKVREVNTQGSVNASLVVEREAKSLWLHTCVVRPRRRSTEVPRIT